MKLLSKKTDPAPMAILIISLIKNEYRLQRATEVVDILVAAQQQVQYNNTLRWYNQYHTSCW